MHTIGVIAFSEQVLADVSQLEMALSRLDYPVRIEQMGEQLQSSRLGDYYYEENAILLWLCNCYNDWERGRVAVERFIEEGVDAMIAYTLPALEIALTTEVESKIPVLFSRISRPQLDDLIKKDLSYKNRIAGVCDIWLAMVEERLSLAAEIVPPPTTVHSFYNPDLPIAVQECEELRRASQRLGLQLVLHEAHSTREVREGLASLKTRLDHVLFRLSDPTVAPAASLMGAVAHEQYIPYIGLTSDELERCGSLFALDVHGVSRQMASIIDDILHDVDPAAIGIIEPEQKVLSVNLQVAQDLGLIISPYILEKAWAVIQPKERRSLRARLLLIVVFASLFLSFLAVAAFQIGFLYFVVTTLITTLAVVLSMYLYIDRKIFRPLQKLTIAAEKFGAGDFNVPLGDASVEDEISILGRFLRRMRSNLSSSYVELEQMTKNLEYRVDELTQTNRVLQQAQRDLEIAGRRIIAAEDSSRFALTTYIHDEILRPLDNLISAANEQENLVIIESGEELERRLRRLRYDLSVPILQDLGIELRRLIQETLPSIYPNARKMQLSMNLAALDQLPGLEPACIFLLYRFARGAVSNVYRHAEANQVAIQAEFKEGKLSIKVSDNGRGFDTNQIEQFIKNGHYFFHDIQIRSRQLRGTFKVESQVGSGTTMQVTVPTRQPGKNFAREINRRQDNKFQLQHSQLPDS